MRRGKNQRKEANKCEPNERESLHSPPANCEIPLAAIFPDVLILSKGTIKASGKNPYDSPGHASGEGPSENCIHTQPYNFIPPLRRKATKPADQDAKTPEVGEACKGIRHDDDQCDTSHPEAVVRESFSKETGPVIMR